MLIQKATRGEGVDYIPDFHRVVIREAFHRLTREGVNYTPIKDITKEANYTKEEGVNYIPTKDTIITKEVNYTKAVKCKE